MSGKLVLFDTHCHFDFTPFNQDYEYHLQQCLSSGVESILIPAIGVSNWQSVGSLVNQFPEQLYFSLGFHPYFLEQRPSEADWQQLEQLLQHRDPHCVAIGECGLDWLIEIDREIQLEIFQRQVDLAIQYQLPIILHSRKSHTDIIRLLKRSNFFHGGIIHGFSGSLQQAKEWVALGFKIGVGGVITYPRAKKTRAAIQGLPIETLVLETDAPDMPINGYQGEANHPKRLPLILRELADLKDMCEVELAEILMKNSFQALRLIRRSGSQ
ncbi:TatD family hydrolase [Vibrio sp. WJH972]